MRPFAAILLVAGVLLHFGNLLAQEPPSAWDKGHDGKPPGESPAQRANGLIQRGEPQRAIGVCLSHLTPDSSNAELRAVLGRAYVARDRVCLPVPPTAVAFQTIEAAPFRCQLSIVPPATRDTVMAVFRAQSALAPDDIRSSLLVADYEARYGTLEGLRGELEKLARFHDDDAKGKIRTHLIGQVTALERPAAEGVIAATILGTDPDTLDCPEIQRLVTALVRSGNFDGAAAALGRVPSDGRCDRVLMPTATMALAVSGRHRELWKITRSLALDIDTISYYRYALTAILAASHFDTTMACKRLAHERLNEDAYPEEARSFLGALDSLLIQPAAPAERWADLAERSLLADGRFDDVRYLLHSLALKRDLRLERSNQALADNLVKRELPLLAAPRFVELAGGLSPGLDRRWDPRRPRFLRQAAECTFAIEDDASCVAFLELIPEPTAEDELMAGVVALRSGDRAAARVAFVRAERQARLPAMVEAARGLAEIAAITTP